MNCPQCQSENPADRTTCAHCGASLVTGSEQPEPDIELVPIFTTGDAAMVPVVRSLLTEEGIEHHVQGEGVREIVGMGLAGAAPVRFFVREVDADRARDLLAHLGPGIELPADEDVEAT